MAIGPDASPSPAPAATVVSSIFRLKVPGSLLGTTAFVTVIVAAGTERPVRLIREQLQRLGELGRTSPTLVQVVPFEDAQTEHARTSTVPSASASLQTSGIDVMSRKVPTFPWR